MTDLVEDLGQPIRPIGPSTPPSMPPRSGDEPGPGSDASFASGAPSWEVIPRTTSRPDRVARRTLIVGHEISLSGYISACDRLVVEGTVEVSLSNCRDLEISVTGLYNGKASVENADVSGRFDGDLVVRKRLVVRAGGHLSGNVTYGQIEIERGGKVSGELEVHEPESAIPFLAEPAFARGR
jgi:cytoskeletal protein CcmA (bactofilin family)